MATAAVLLCLLASAATACPVDIREHLSPNKRFSVRTFDGMGCQSVELRRGESVLCEYPEGPVRRAVVADDGSCAVTLDDFGWSAYDAHARCLAHFSGKGSRTQLPLRLLIDAPRTCWRAGPDVYLQFSQGDALKLQADRFTELTPAQIAATHPPTWAQMPVQATRWNAAQLKRKLRALEPRDEEPWAYRDNAANSDTLFRPLHPATAGQLRAQASQQNGAAALALGLAGDLTAVPLLTSLAVSQGKAAPSAQHALMLLLGTDAAPILARCLNSGKAAELTLHYFCLVPCRDAVRPLLNHLQLNTGHQALVRQARVDFGDKPRAWSEWLRDYESRSQRPYAARRPVEPLSEPLWQAQRGSLNPTTLVSLPRLVAVMTTNGNTVRYTLLSDRLVRASGSTDGAILEWSLTDGSPVTKLPAEMSSSGHFDFNSSRQLLLYRSRHQASAWLRGEKIWSQPSYLKLLRGMVLDSGLAETLSFYLQNWDAEFSEDEEYLCHRSEPTNSVRRLAQDGSVCRRGDSTGPAWLSYPAQTPSYAAPARATWMLHGRPVRQIKLFSISDELGFPLLELQSNHHHAFSPDGSRLALTHPLQLLGTAGPIVVNRQVQAKWLQFADNGQRLLVATEHQVLLLNPHNLKVDRSYDFSDGCPLATDASASRVVVVDGNNVRVYSLDNEVPRVADQRLLAELWTGHRLIAGAARPLTPEEFWERSARLNQQRQSKSQSPSPPTGSPDRATAALTLLALLALPSLRRRRTHKA